MEIKYVKVEKEKSVNKTSEVVGIPSILKKLNVSDVPELNEDCCFCLLSLT